jgi:hypothetical protein
MTVMAEQQLVKLQEGTYVLLVSCPECELPVHFPIELSGRLTVDNKGSKLRPLLTTKALDHACGTDAAQEPLPFPAYLQQR